MVKYNAELPLFSLHIPKSGGTSFENVLIQWFTTKNKQFLNIQNHPRLQMKARGLIERGLPQVPMGDNLLLHYKNHIKENIPNIVYKLDFIKKITKRPVCVHGHFSESVDGENLFDFYPNARQFIAFFRDPLELHLSMFHYHKKLREKGGFMYKGGRSKLVIRDVDEWLENRNSHMLDFIPFNFKTDNYQDLIQKYFVYVGVTEEFQSSLDVLADKLKKPKIMAPMVNFSKRTENPSESSIKKFRQNNELTCNIYDHVLKIHKEM